MGRDDLGHTIRIMFEQSPIAMCAVMTDGTIVRKNSAFDELIPSAVTILTLVREADRDALGTSLREVGSGVLRSFTSEAGLASGNDRWCEINGVAMNGGTGDVMMHVVEITERRRREARLRKLAECDPLTGAQNRLSLHRILAERLAARQTGTLLMLDLDGFKAVNDTLGHQRGDEVLVAVASAIRETVPATAIVARLGGDEFAVLLDSDAPAATALGAALIRRIENAATRVAGSVRVTASVGIGRLQPARDLESILAEVDLAMYAAKRAGKARCVEAVPAAAGTVPSGRLLRVFDREANLGPERSEPRSYLA
ncbi:MAG TPA: sensor domain-containing diguanylate cyclase [Candidatus Acidoferrum sp.]|nr:sensor domain-containing diguanylate cyclase [Candidatus Acidoferrum sp.]